MILAISCGVNVPAAIDLEVPIQSPESIADINLKLLAEHQGGSIAVISYVEGVIAPASNLTVPPKVKNWIAGGFNVGQLEALMLITDTDGNDGQKLCDRIRKQLYDVLPKYRYSGEGLYSSKQSQRKPSAFLGHTAMKRLLAMKDMTASRVIMVGSNRSDMVMADTLHHECGLYMGFMVAQLGEQDQKPGFFVRKRRNADEFREKLQAANQPQIYVSPSSGSESDT